jgi:hypothetical protein
MTTWTQEEFNSSARALVQALHPYPLNQAEHYYYDDDDDDACNKLLKWQLMEPDIKADPSSSCLYLVHPPVLQTTTTRIIQEEDKELDDNLLVDESIQIDPDCVIPTTNSKDDNYLVEIVWNLSIVYSDTWRVPVLYFQVESRNGSPLVRSHVLQLLNGGDEGIRDYGWDLVSQEEHPISARPSYFLHPCQTSQRLALVRGQDEDDNNNNNNPPAVHQLLWTWMSMMFPVLGHSIPSRCFQKVQRKMMERLKDKISKAE